MKSGWFNTVISAIVGGVVGAVVVFTCGGGSSSFPGSVDKLKVGELIVSDKMMLWTEGAEDASLLIQNGGILAKTRVIAQQLCGNAVLANCVLTTPDNVLNKLEECVIFTEMGSSPVEGGMLTVRSPNGGNVLARQEGVTTGLAYTVTYDNQGRPVNILRSNDSGKQLVGQFVALPPGLEHVTVAVYDPSMQQQQAEQQADVSQQMPPGAPVNPMQGMPGNPPSVPNTGIDHQAMTPMAPPR